MTLSRGSGHRRHRSGSGRAVKTAKVFRQVWRRRGAPRDRVALRPQFYVLAGWLVVVFLLGGGARGDIASLEYLRPASILVLGYGLWHLKAEQLRTNRVAFALAAAWVLLLVVQLLPLPPGIWQALPGREIVRDIELAAGLGDTWRPLSMVPYATRNALWATAVPLAVLVLGVQLDPAERVRLLPVVLVLGAVSAAIAILQLSGDPFGRFYFYRITNNGTAVGLFANRNHQAIFLAMLFPMMLAWLRMRRRGGGVQAPVAATWFGAANAIAGAAILITLVLITGSRSGFLLAVLTIVAAPLLVAAPASEGRERQSRNRVLTWLLLAVMAAIAFLTVLSGRGLAVERLLGLESADELRLQIVPTLFAMIGHYAPWGTGVGTFEQVYKLHEPAALLGPAYVNHAHNDWLEIALTGGVPALAIVAVACVAFARAFMHSMKDEGMDAASRIPARLGVLIVLVLGLASLADYPLRVPSLACVAVLAVLWAGAKAPRPPIETLPEN
jgi:O-antigen ligase